MFTDSAALERVVVAAFPSLETAADEAFSDMYVYTTAVCDIILNPDNPTLEVSRKSLDLRMLRFKVVFIEITFLLLL